MKLLSIVMFSIIQNVYSSGSSLKIAKRLLSGTSIEENLNPDVDDFPDVEYPQSALGSSPFFYKSGVLDPFTEDIKSTFKTISEETKKPTKSLSKSDSLADTDVHAVLNNTKNNYKNDSLSINNSTSEYITEKTIDGDQNVLAHTEECNIDDLNQSTDIDVKAEQIETKENADNAINSSLTSTETKQEQYQEETPIKLNETASLERRKRSTCEEDDVHVGQTHNDNEISIDKTSDKNTKATTVETFSSSEAVLPRPPPASDDEDGIVIDNEDDLLVSLQCEENFVVDNTNTDESGKDL